MNNTQSINLGISSQLCSYFCPRAGLLLPPLTCHFEENVDCTSALISSELVFCSIIENEEGSGSYLHSGWLISLRFSFDLRTYRSHLYKHACFLSSCTYKEGFMHASVHSSGHVCMRTYVHIHIHSHTAHVYVQRYTCVHMHEKAQSGICCGLRAIFYMFACAHGQFMLVVNNSNSITQRSSLYIYITCTSSSANMKNA